jgi:hypothetical protein
MLLAVAASVCADVYGAAVDDAKRAEVAAFLADQLDTVLQAGENPMVWLTVLGEKKTYRVLSVDQKSITVEVQKNPFPVKWPEVPPDDMAGIARSIAGDKSERLLVAAEVALDLGYLERANDILMQIHDTDDDVKAKINNLAGQLSKLKPGLAAASKTVALTAVKTTEAPSGPAAIPAANQEPINGPVINVGPTRACKTIASGLQKAKAGDTVLVDLGTYNEVFKMKNSGRPDAPVVLRGVLGQKGERPLIDAQGISVSGAGPTPRSIIQIEGEYCVVENLELKNARNGNNGAGVRFNDCTNAILRGCKITYCDMGIMGGDKQTVLIQRCEVAFNGTKDFNGYSHNFYFQEGNRAVIQECYVHNSLFGQNIKSRGHYLELWYNVVCDGEEGEIGFVNSAATTKPNSNALLVGNLVVSKKDRKGNPTKFVDFSGEGPPRPGTLYLFNNTFVAGTARILFVHLAEAQNELVAANNIFVGSDKIAESPGAKARGTNNFMGASATGFQNTLKGADPLFVNPAGRDFHLGGSSPCCNVGATSDALSYTDGDGKALKAVPAREIVFPLNSKPRSKKTTLDIGAFGL